MALSAWQIPQQLWDISGNLQNSLLGIFQSLQKYLTGLFSFGAARSPNAATPANVTPIFQAASTVGTTDAGGGLTITFPQPFPNGLICVTGINGDHAATANMKPEIFAAGTNLTQANFTCITANTGAVIASGSVRIDWIAVGW